MDSYSQFVSTYQDASLYESKLVEASEVRQGAVKVYERRGKFIEGIDGDEKVDWTSWINFEKKKIDAFIIKGIYERAISSTARQLWALTPTIFSPPSPLELQTLSYQLLSLRRTLEKYWLNYISTFRSLGKGEDREIVKRGVRSVPWSGSVWGAYLRSLESVEGARLAGGGVDKDGEVGETVEGAFERALSVRGLVEGHASELFPLDASPLSSFSSAFSTTFSTSNSYPSSASSYSSTNSNSKTNNEPTDGVENLISLVLSKVSYERRKIEEGEGDGLMRGIVSLERGIEVVRYGYGGVAAGAGEDEDGKGKKGVTRVRRGGDRKLRLERVLSDLVSYFSSFFDPSTVHSSFSSCTIFVPTHHVPIPPIRSRPLSHPRFPIPNQSHLALLNRTKN